MTIPKIPLKSIEEHNEEVVQRNLAKEKTGIACPDCQEELVYQGDTFFSIPPQREVRCLECGFVKMVYV